MSKVLYRKYRPLTLSDVIGQDQIVKPLQTALKQGKIGHAYLFIGPRGTGKTSVARIFAHAINHFPYRLEDHHLDIIEIDAASNTGVDNIRDLREKAILAPAEGKYKVYIIDEVHMLSKSANNALLKTLEEPPEHVVFIMATTEAEKIPITISSRTQIFRFNLADPKVMTAHLRKIADAENISITDDALGLIAKRGGGSFRDSLSLLDQITTLTDQKITTPILEQALGLPSTDAVQQILAAYTAADATTIRVTLMEAINNGLAPETLAAELIAAIIEQPTAATLPLLATLTTVAAPFPEAKLLLALLDGKLAATEKPETIIAKKPKAVAAKKPAAAQKSIKSKLEPTAEPEPDTQPEPTAAPKPQTPTTTPFSWDEFLASIRAASASVAVQLEKCQYDFDGTTLHLYPSNKICAGILKRPQHNAILTAHLTSFTLLIHDTAARATGSSASDSSAADPKLQKLSDALGNIQDFSGDTPF